MAAKKLDPPINIKTILGFLMVAAALAGLFYGSRAALHHFKQTPWYVRFDVRAYLKKQSGRSNFKSDFDLNIKQTVASLETGLAEFKAKIAAVETNVAKLTQELGELRQKKQEALTQAQSLKSALASLEQQQAAKERRLTNQLEELEQWRQKAAAQPSNAPGLQKQVEAAQASAHTLQTNVAALKIQAGDKHAGWLAKQKEITALEAASDAKTKEREDQRAELAKLRQELPKRQQEVAQKQQDANSLAASLTREFRGKMAKASGYAAMYATIGEQLWIADELFATPEAEKRRLGFQAASEASRYAMQSAENLVLSARIIEGWLLPNLEAADPPGETRPVAAQALKELNDCALAYQAVELTNEMVRVCNLLIDHSLSTQFADDRRYFVAQEYELRKEYAEAIRYLRQITDTNYAAQAAQRIAALEPKLNPPPKTNTAANPPKKP